MKAAVSAEEVAAAEQRQASAARFSAAAYAARLQEQQGDASLEGAIQGVKGDGGQDLSALTEEARNMLAAPRGFSEEDRRRYAEKLNRAVIGFPQERYELLAILSDWIIKKRLQHANFG